MAGYFTVVTDYGLSEMVEAVRNGTKVNVTEFAAGDGGGAACVPSAAQTGLAREVWRGAVGACRVSGDSGNLMIVKCVMPSDVGGFTVREMGIFDDKGGMVAVCNTPDTQKARESDGMLHELALSMEIALTNAESVRIVTDPNAVALKEDLNALSDQIEEVRSSVPTIPECLPANGGNADTVGGKSAEELQDYNNLANRPTVGAPVYISTTAPTDTTGLWVVPPT